jgi:hypothetical protein
MGAATAGALSERTPIQRNPSFEATNLRGSVDRHSADLIIHRHAHHGKLDGRTTAGIPVHNVAITLLRIAATPGGVPRL